MHMIFPHASATRGGAAQKTRKSAVMLLLYTKEEAWHLLAIRRSADGGAHSAQVGLPGGRHEPSDDSLLATALRETYEEVGIAPNHILPIGALSPVYIAVSNFEVMPYVGYWHSQAPLVLSSYEVDEVIELPLAKLLAPGTKAAVSLRTPAHLHRTVNAYCPSENVVIWGATALMIAELEILLGA